MPSLVIIGGGHATAFLCHELIRNAKSWSRDDRWRIDVISEETCMPYQRPPLSKTYIKGGDSRVQPLLSPSFYEDNDIRLHLGTRVESIDRDAKRLAAKLTQDDNQVCFFEYDYLVLATGSQPRRPSFLLDNRRNIDGIHFLHTLADASRLSESLKAVSSVSVLGGGFIGLEVAATAMAMGKKATVVEAGNRLLSRSLSPQMSQAVYERHRAAGMDIRLASIVTGLATERGDFPGLCLSDGEVIEADLVVIGIGSVPKTELASECGLPCENGIVVDANLSTQDSSIFAIGDCAAFPDSSGSGRLRLESVANAQTHAEILASLLLRKPSTTRPGHMPWFWSDQGDIKLKINGIWRPDLTRAIARTGDRPGSISIFHFDGHDLACVETCNSPTDHVVARRWLSEGYSPDIERLTDPEIPLKYL